MSAVCDPLGRLERPQMGRIATSQTSDLVQLFGLGREPFARDSWRNGSARKERHQAAVLGFRRTIGGTCQCHEAGAVPDR